MKKPIRLVPRYDVDDQGSCSKCGGAHYGTGRNCVYTDEQIRNMQETEATAEIPMLGTVT